MKDKYFPDLSIKKIHIYVATHEKVEEPVFEDVKLFYPKRKRLVPGAGIYDLTLFKSMSDDEDSIECIYTLHRERGNIDNVYPTYRRYSRDVFNRITRTTDSDWVVLIGRTADNGKMNVMKLKNDRKIFWSIYCFYIECKNEDECDGLVKWLRTKEMQEYTLYLLEVLGGMKANKLNTDIISYFPYYL